MIFKKIENIGEIGTGILPRVSSGNDRYVLFLDVPAPFNSWFFHRFDYCEVSEAKIILYNFNLMSGIKDTLKVYDI